MIVQISILAEIAELRRRLDSLGHAIADNDCAEALRILDIAHRGIEQLRAELRPGGCPAGQCRD